MCLDPVIRSGNPRASAATYGSQAELKRKLSETLFDQAHSKYWTKLDEVSDFIL